MYLNKSSGKFRSTSKIQVSKISDKLQGKKNLWVFFPFANVFLLKFSWNGKARNLGMETRIWLQDTFSVSTIYSQENIQKIYQAFACIMVISCQAQVLSILPLGVFKLE